MRVEKDFGFLLGGGMDAGGGGGGGVLWVRVTSSFQDKGSLGFRVQG